MRGVAELLNISQHQVAYAMHKYGIERRSRSEATYCAHHPNGDPFCVRTPATPDEVMLWGIGLGLYWGEGNKANRHAVRLGNTDPSLIRTFIRFLVELCGVARDDLRFGVQIFSDIEPEVALAFWQRELGAKPSQFYRVTVTISGSLGTYRHKSKYGVVTVCYHNKKLRDILVGMLPR